MNKIHPVGGPIGLPPGCAFCWYLQRMNRIYWLGLVFTAVLCAPGQAAEKPSATTRAYLYKREARTVLIARGWHLSCDENGKLVADHPLGPMAAGFSGTNQIGLTSRPLPANGPLRAFAWLTLTFQPESSSRTKCAANIVAYYLWEGMKKGKAKPVPFNNPDTTKEIQDMMAKAEGALETKYPEYARK